jgi:hypothetical protein
VTPTAARVRARVWSDVPTIRNIGFIGVLLGLAAFYGGEVGRIRATPGKVDRVERDVAALKRDTGFLVCKGQDSTPSQCIHHLRDL